MICRLEKYDYRAGIDKRRMAAELIRGFFPPDTGGEPFHCYVGTQGTPSKYPQILLLLNAP
jgi:hypothetical protein